MLAAFNNGSGKVALWLNLMETMLMKNHEERFCFLSSIYVQMNKYLGMFQVRIYRPEGQHDKQLNSRVKFESIKNVVIL